MAYVYLAWACHYAGDYQARNETIEKAMALSSRTSQKDRLFLEAGHALFVEQDYDRHFALLTELVQRYPDEKWAFHYLGDSLFQYRYDAPGAREQYEKWLALDPQSANAISHLISACAMMGDFKKAAELIKMHDAVAPRDPYFLMVQAMTYALMGQLDQAIAKSKEALGMRPDFNLPFLNLILVHAMREEYEESLRWSDEYISSAAAAGLKCDAYGLRGFLRYWRGSYGDALSDFDRADKMAEAAGNWATKADALEGKGAVYLAQGEFDLSRAAFEKQLEILVERVRTWIPFQRAYLAWRLGLLAARQGQTAVAMIRLSEMRAASREMEGRGKNSVIALADLLEGEALLAQGDLDGALVASKKARGPVSPVWLYGSGWHSLGYTLPYLDLTARVLAQKGKIAEAVSEYERLLKTSDPTESMLMIHPLYHYRLGILYEKAGDGVKAKAQYTRFLEIWKDADPGRPEIEDAKKRLSALGI